MREYDPDYDDNYDGEDESTCPYCKGRGYLTVESDGGGPAYHCPDCGDDEEENDE
jgi:tRNA(Ile2) C34 agmatinyltransferase TiaS